jgi:cytochrome b involved in lipid metabolism
MFDPLLLNINLNMFTYMSKFTDTTKEKQPVVSLKIETKSLENKNPEIRCVKFSELENVFKPEGKKVLVINDNIYDFTQFADEHPGGSDILENFLYKDATNIFNDIGHSNSAILHLYELLVGVVENI